MEAINGHAWKEIVEWDEIAKKSAKKFELFALKNKEEANNKSRGIAQSSQAKRKKMLAVKVSGEALPNPKKSNSNSTLEFKSPQRQYSSKDEHVVTIFHLFNKGNKLKLPETRHPKELGCMNDPNYCLIHGMVHHFTSRCYILKDKIQALVDASVLTLKSEKKEGYCQHGNSQFWKLPAGGSSRGTNPHPKGKMKVINPLSEDQEGKGLITLTTKSREVMWVHPDIVNDKQWDLSQPKSRENFAMSFLLHRRWYCTGKFSQHF